MDSFTLRKIEFDEVRAILSGFCACGLGKKLAARIGPSRNPRTIRRWLKQVSDTVVAVRDVGVPPFGGAADISEELTRVIPGGGAGAEDFAKIASVLDAATNVRDYLNALPEALETLHELAGRMGSFQREVSAIREVVEPDGTVRDDASQRLASIRRDIGETTRRIHDVIYGYLQQPEVSRLLQTDAVTLHGDRYVLPVKTENRGRLPGVVHRASKSGATVFVEPNASVELNNHLADLYEDERTEIRRLLNELTLRLAPRVEEMASTLRVLGQVDLLSAKAQYAYQRDMTCPEIVERGAVQLTGARHPLLIEQTRRQERQQVDEARPQRVVPIDIRLGADFDLLVITGSNTGGKTVTLKTLALLVVMAQSGMHIPAGRGATLPVFRDVYIDIGDEQSLQQSLSTFGAHVKRITYILRKADRSSLVLLDELGAGTDPDEGGAIGQAILDELRRIGCLGMVTTHLSVLKAYAYNHARVDNASVEFDTKTLSPTYHLRIGTPGESHAITVAQRLGMSRRITGTARRHLSDQGKQFRRAIRATSVARQSAEEARAEAHEARLAAESDQEAYQSKLADLHTLKEQFETWLATLGEWKRGDEIFVPSLGKPGRLVRLELHRQLAVVDAGNMQVEVPLRELMPDLGQEEVRRQIAELREQILAQARRAEEAQAEARHLREEYQRSVQQQKQRARQFDTWLAAIGRLRVGQDVPIARKPGVGKVVKVDLLGLRATVQTQAGEVQLPIQELFPQTGRFAQAGRRRQRQRGEQKGGRAADRDRPLRRRSAESKAARKNLEALLAVEPGQQVYVVPFHKRATVIRINRDKRQAVVQSGVFEMELPLADLEPIRERKGHGAGQS